MYFYLCVFAYNYRNGSIIYFILAIEKKIGNHLQLCDIPVSIKIILPVSVTDSFRQKQNRFDFHFNKNCSEPPSDVRST